MSATAVDRRLASWKPTIRRLLDRFPERFADFVVNVFGQVRVLRKAYPGVMHALIFWGVTVQVLGTAINLVQMQLFIPLVELPFPRGGAYLAYEAIMDAAGVAILIGVGMALFRRLVLRPKTLQTGWDDYYALAVLGLLPIAGFTVEGLRLLASSPEWSTWSWVGAQVAGLLAALGVTADRAAALHPYLVVTHVGLGLLFFASLPFTKLRHLVTAPLNVIFRDRRNPASLSFIRDIDEVEQLGVGQIEEFTPRQLLSLDACVRCGRCEELCPASGSGMPFSPRNVVQDLRAEMNRTLIAGNGNGDEQLLGGALPEHAPWYCTTCGACLDVCPAYVSPMEEIIDLRRYQVLTTGKIEKSVADVLRNMERQGNPWAIPPEDRMAWAEDLDLLELQPGDEIDVLWFVGCACSFDERSRKSARAFARLLQSAGVQFGVLGLDEGCCGETARRLGHEYLFQVFAEQNLEILSQIKFQRIVTQCPHCFNTLKNEYPQLGGELPVIHAVELLEEIGISGAAGEDGTDGLGRIGYHDSCYLGRYNGIYIQPRRLLDRAGLQPVEMERNGRESFCCGGGGGQMWMETDAETRINHRRLEHALAAHLDTVTTACPYCTLMFDDAIRSRGLGEEIQVLDISEVLEQRLSAAASSGDRLPADG